MALDVMQSVEIIEVLENFIERIRPPENIRHKLDIGYKTDNQSVTIYELRPWWSGNGEMQESSIAKATFVRAGNCWKVFWQRADLKWHPYPPMPRVKTITEFIQLVEADEHGCFWG
jgi:hypothetical protein